MEIHLTAAQITMIFQIFGIPLLAFILHWLKKSYRSNKLNGFKITALVYAMQVNLKNGFSKDYENKLEQLKDDAKFVEDR